MRCGGELIYFNCQGTGDGDADFVNCWASFCELPSTFFMGSKRDFHDSHILHTHTHTCMYIQTCTCMQYTHACVHTHTHTHAHTRLFPWFCPLAFIFRQVPGTERPPKRWYAVNWYIVYPGLHLFWTEAERGRSIFSAEWNVCFPFFVLKTW